MPEPRQEPRAFVLGGNASTLAFVSSFRPESDAVVARLVPLAATPLGMVAGDSWQKVTIALANLVDWVDQTFAPTDDRAFVASGRDIDLLVRTAWHAEAPERLDEREVLNAEDLPDDVADALAHPPEPLVQCRVCRRLCVRDHFVWNERQLCAWDYHSTVFGKRGPWREATYEAHHFALLPPAAYVAGPLLDELAVEAVMNVNSVDDETARALINLLLERDGTRPHIAVRTLDGFALLRERGAPEAQTSA